MKSRELESLFRRYLLPDLPDFGAKGLLLFAKPIVHLLRGFYFDTSRFDRDDFYIEAFVQPLYVPFPTFSFNFGKRLLDTTRDRWSLNREDAAATMTKVLASIKKQGLPFIGRVQTPKDLAEKALLLTNRQDDPNDAEAVAYSLVLARQFPEARHALDRLQLLLQGEGDELDPWLSQVLDRSVEIRERLKRDPEDAVSLLDQWTEQTRARLRLPQEPQP